MAEGEKKPVDVFCTVPNGVALRLTRVLQEGGGFEQRYPVDPPVVLAGPLASGPVATAVDPDFWAAWLAENDGNPLLANRSVYVAGDEEEEREEGATG